MYYPDITGQEIPAASKNIQFAKSVVKVDLSFLVESSEGDREYTKAMISMFLESMLARINMLQDQIDHQDWSALCKTAHLTKSTLSVVKIDQLYDLASELEILATTGKDLKKARLLLSQFRFFYNKSVLLLQKKLISYQ